ncbi:NADPH-dependent 2,4-dienoyl-CoA reductase [Caballeronia sp. LZ001]|uniref:NADPH-dependent 2,4-dienoyl-CoA reductase n=1 Tax=Caballeronia sp. LZ001 TaxID=3038553 RepID=UPI002854442E|nr:NADPH-dependent 2,4-dienoyl-CoA reductase [Caballeronia sp. LZ001]MDR5804860.1 NADPH-dependent 2,4-dienoyl-CoA reductase [Caballeronia sp. LZ001]
MMEHLLAPLKVGSVPLRNRMVMGAMHTRIETLTRPDERLAAFYAERAAGEVGLIVSGGFSPNAEGVMEQGGPLLNSTSQLEGHRVITRAVHECGGKIIMQILHAGRYAKVSTCVAPSAGMSRVNSFSPRVLTTEQVWATIADFVRTAELAIEAGYDGVEVMGSEGYLINEFTAERTNQRDDEFGGDFEGRVRFPLEIVRAIRTRLGAPSILIYRISAIDLVEGGLTGDEITTLARWIESAGADAINTGVGWHEARVPTIAASVPRAVWRDSVLRVKRAVGIPVIVSNRINTPQLADELIADGVADMVSMARPLLADPEFARKTRLGIADEINTCIACNQSCLDRIFTGRTTTCLVNPRAGREIEFSRSKRSDLSRRIAVVGGGPAGMSFAVNAAERGHEVTLFEADCRLGGQINLARIVPGKAEFQEMLRYFDARLKKLEVTLRLGEAVTAERLGEGRFDEIILATGVRPRVPSIPGIEHPKTVSYVDILSGRLVAGPRVAIIGAGGIGFDVAEFLVGDPNQSLDASAFFRFWGVDPISKRRGGLEKEYEQITAARVVHMFQRSDEPFGKHLGKSTGWIAKAKLRRANITMTAGVTYDAIDDGGLHYSISGQPHTLQVDHVVICAGHESNRDLYGQLLVRGMRPRLIGGADIADELDASRAIEQATRLALSL